MKLIVGLGNPGERYEASGVWLMLPQSHMNLSGRPVQMLAAFFKIAPADILVAHDELDFPPGAVRMKQGGGVAGHNGLKDISARLGTHDYWRLRIGIGHPGDRDAVSNYVLGRPAQEDRAAIDAALGGALEILPLVLAGDMQGAMLKLHSRPEPERAAPAPKPEKPKKQAQAQPAEQPKPDKAAKAEPAPAAKQPEPAEKPGGLGSFFKKLVPGSGDKPKK